MKARANETTGALFDEFEAPTPAVAAASHPAMLVQLASRLPDSLRLGTSSWNFPGWNSLVWDGRYSAARLSRDGLSAYAQHPLFRSVSLDRSFYQPLSGPVYAGYAACVPDDFRFVVKAPALITDAWERRRGTSAGTFNPGFLDPEIALESFVLPARRGLGEKLGVLVFQISPLPRRLLDDMPALIERLGVMLRICRSAIAGSEHVLLAVEVRNPEWLIPALTESLQSADATYCLGLHPRLPPADRQLPILRALWPGPLVCRWNLNVRHGIQGYEKARANYAPFDTLVDPDPAARDILVRVVLGTTNAGHAAYVTVNNKAEGSAPLSVRALAESVAAAR